MLKKLLAIPALTAICATASFATAAPVVNTAPLAPRTPFINSDIATARTMTACQVEEYARCISKFGDHDMCVMQAQMTMCTD